MLMMMMMMKPTLLTSFFFNIIFIIIWISTSHAPFVISQQTDSCSSTPSINGISFDITNFQCFSVWESQGFILRYRQTEDRVWSFVLSAPERNGYVGIGFSRQGSMVGSSAIVGWVGSNGGVIKQYYLGGKDSSLVNPDEGELEVVSSTSGVFTVSSSSSSSRIYITFQLNTSLPLSRLLYAIGPQGRLPSSPDFRLVQHDTMTSTTIDYLSGRSTNSKPYSRLRRSHGVLNMVGWGVVMPIGVIIARYFKHADPFWFYAHTSIQSGGFILGLSGVICGLVLYDRINADVAKHRALGIVVLVLGGLQVTAFLARPDKASKVRKYWNWYHHGLGRVMIVLAVANVFYGIHLGNAGTGWNAGFGVVLAFLCIAAIVLEFRKWARK